jgi:hypothetical protein
MHWFQKPCQEAQDSFKENKFLDDREILYDPAIISALSASSRKSPYFEGSFDPKGLSPEQLANTEVIDPKSVKASLYDVHVLKHLFQHFTSKENSRYMLEHVAVFPIPEPGQGVLYAATNAQRIAFFHSRISQASHFLMLEIPSDFLKAIKADRFGEPRPLEIEDGQLSAETNGVKSALPLENVCRPGLLFPNVSNILPHRIEVREMLGGHSPNMRLDDLSSFTIKGAKENYIRLLMPMTRYILVFADTGLWGMIMSLAKPLNEEAPLPPIFKEVWPHEGGPDPWLEAAEEEKKNEAINEREDLAA